MKRSYQISTCITLWDRLLVSLLKDAGFWTEAGRILDEARVVSDPHENVGSTIAALQKAKDDEQLKWAKLEQAAGDARRHMRAYGTAYFDNSFTSSDWHGEWFDSRGDIVQFADAGNQILVEWNRREPLVNKNAIVKHTLRGERHHGTARFRYETKREPDRSLFSLGQGGAVECFGYIDAACETCTVFSADPKHPIRLQFSRNPPQPKEPRTE